MVVEASQVASVPRSVGLQSVVVLRETRSALLVHQGLSLAFRSMGLPLTEAWALVSAVDPVDVAPEGGF